MMTYYYDMTYYENITPCRHYAMPLTPYAIFSERQRNSALPPPRDDAIVRAAATPLFAASLPPMPPILLYLFFFYCRRRRRRRLTLSLFLRRIAAAATPRAPCCRRDDRHILIRRHTAAAAFLSFSRCRRRLFIFRCYNTGYCYCITESFSSSRQSRHYISIYMELDWLFYRERHTQWAAATWRLSLDNISRILRHEKAYIMYFHFQDADERSPRFWEQLLFYRINTDTVLSFSKMPLRSFRERAFHFRHITSDEREYWDMTEAEEMPPLWAYEWHI